MENKNGKLNKVFWILCVVFLLCSTAFFAYMYFDASAKGKAQQSVPAAIQATPGSIGAISAPSAETSAPTVAWPTPTPTMLPEQIAALETSRSRSEMESFDLRLDAYARILCEAVHTQAGDVVLVEAPIEASELAALTVKHCYEAGAKTVYTFYSDKRISDLNKRYLNGEALDEYAFSKLGIYYAAGKESGLKDIVLLSLDPPSEYELTEEENAAYSTAQYNYSIKHFNEDMEKQTRSPYWTVGVYPTRFWAEKVYPELAPKEALDKLWNDLFSFMYIDESGATSGFFSFNDDLEKLQDKLNSLDIRELWYKSSTMDLHVKLHEGNIFEGGAAQLEGSDYLYNVPSLELFGMPDKYGVNGTLKTTRPLCINGSMDKMVEDIELTIKNGKIVDYSAKKGYEAFKEYMEADENNFYLGEAALVSADTPIFKTGRIFYEALLDENACCHVALGDAYEEFNLSEGTEPDENVNECDWHMDIMVGSADLDVTATLRDGSTLPIIKNGVWAIQAD